MRRESRVRPAGFGVVAMEAKMNKCTAMETKLANLLLDPSAASAELKQHVAGCDDCRRELDELRATMALMDAWKAPEPNPYFMTRMEARLREESLKGPAGWFARLKARFAMEPGARLRPLAAMAMTFLLLIGGGAYLGISNLEQLTVASPQAAVVHELQDLDSNAQLLDQLEQISSNSDNGD